jgi:hypothetical protein
LRGERRVGSQIIKSGVCCCVGAVGRKYALLVLDGKEPCAWGPRPGTHYAARFSSRKLTPPSRDMSIAEPKSRRSKKEGRRLLQRTRRSSIVVETEVPEGPTRV